MHGQIHACLTASLVTTLINTTTDILAHPYLCIQMFLRGAPDSVHPWTVSLSVLQNSFAISNRLWGTFWLLLDIWILFET